MGVDHLSDFVGEIFLQIRGSMSVASSGYRRDVDGLRAIAVLSVLLYHFGFSQVRGGFVGVDVFFVISGFLITNIVQAEISNSTFTFLGFYERRIRRIFPALFVMMISVVSISPFLLLPSDMERLGRYLATTLFFVSNIYYWSKSGYFDAVSDQNPLLHTWSLGIEEQFYIILPIFLISMRR